MTYEIENTPSGAIATIRSSSREELFTDALAAALAAAYAGTPALGTLDGQFVPIQAAGDDDATLLSELVKDCLEAVRTAPGTLHPPRWMAFDEKRVTANLPLSMPKAGTRPVSMDRVAIERPLPGLLARVSLSLPAAH